MNSSDTRVQTYLDDLARMLSDVEPGERDEVLAGIREHLDATLAEHHPSRVRKWSPGQPLAHSRRSELRSARVRGP
ncbi:MAG TPA: hypothetical protein VES93_10090 [Ornithinibacter sp.]|nr:hypothetical protein [Ornithinibacter sp.]